MDPMSALRRLFGQQQASQPQQRATPQRAAAPAPAQRDFPGRTNYGVPQDNMIDTPEGYITRQQYNTSANNATQSRQQAPLDPKYLGYEPDMTFNPTEQFIPFSSRNMPMGQSPRMGMNGLSEQSGVRSPLDDLFRRFR